VTWTNLLANKEAQKHKTSKKGWAWSSLLSHYEMPCYTMSSYTETSKTVSILSLTAALRISPSHEYDAAVSDGHRKLRWSGLLACYGRSDCLGWCRRCRRSGVAGALYLHAAKEADQHRGSGHHGNPNANKVGFPLVK
jgi:hypothetical protein